MEAKEVKCVIVGDSGVGKSYFLITYITNMYPNFYTATSIDTLTTNVDHKGTTVKLSLYDIGGSDDYDRLRPMFYKEADIVVMCFSISDPVSLENIKTHWLTEVKHYCFSKPIIFVGCKLDLRNDQGTIQRLKARKYVPVTYDEGFAVSQEIGALNYFECSSLHRSNLKEIINEVVRIGLNPPRVFQCPCCVL